MQFKFANVATYDKPYLGRLLCHYIIIVIVFMGLYFHNAFMGGLCVGGF